MARSNDIFYTFPQHYYGYQEMKFATEHVAMWLKENVKEERHKVIISLSEHPLDVWQYAHCAELLKVSVAPKIMISFSIGFRPHYAIWARMQRVESEYLQMLNDGHNWTDETWKDFRSHVHFLQELMRAHDILLRPMTGDSMRCPRSWTCWHRPRRICSVDFPWIDCTRDKLALRRAEELAD
ncbi:hypothetical protein BO82DRAFT_424125 [Aspergillus uvarum CBS 121591]|uniref:Uncharacterized protein n=1 Tax=Aspergillus uvarum CBS 121591 TaxID=1448315 RepID=A0A319E2I5_9EURO|nr:hypothetical protein BO82DRAFT_424125 [Aspergillus uvarum CBS 121591]PYH85342.1 hypothetical protein BO82DRAFT_424125 [Aspergillus uvarum CBS 121591]